MVFSISLPHSLASDILLGLVVPLVFVGAGYQIGKYALAEEALPNLNVIEEAEEDEDEKAWLADGDLAAISPGLLEPCKMVLVVRTDLKLTPGSIYSQCCRATLACYKALYKKNRSVGRKPSIRLCCSHRANFLNEQLVQHWERTGQAKIALKVKSEDELLELEAVAKSLNLCARSVLDPEKGENVRAVLAIGPAPIKLVDEVTGKLRLL